MSTNYNPFNRYTSKVKRFNIPLPEYEFYHKSSSEESVDRKFIGRERISERLKNWLTDEKTHGGSYLITGYRGIGKSSFVGKILYEICLTESVTTRLLGLCIFAFLSFTLFYFFYKVLNTLTLQAIYWYLGVLIIGGGVLMGIISWIYTYWYKIKNYMQKVAFAYSIFIKGNIKRSHLLQQLRGDWEKIRKEIYSADIRNKRCDNLIVKINLGHEVLNEKDILCLIANGLYEKYKNFVYSPIANIRCWFLRTIFTFAFAFFLAWGWYTYLDESIWNFIIKQQWQSFINFHQIFPSVWLSCMLIITCLIISYWIGNKLISYFAYSQTVVLNKLCFLNERINSSVNTDANIKTNAIINLLGITFGHNRKRTYQLASVREMEQELIDILERNSKLFFHPSFFIVFDELDKIDLEERDNWDKEKNWDSVSPEYTNEENFPGGGTSRKRKENVLKLLANMKLFISTAHAKFIFISGRELYDAYLADLSDREFSISSVFNGIIYVESFCTSDENQKEIVSNTETYICKQLIPLKYLRKQYIERYHNYILNNGTSKFEKINIDLKLYYKYLITEIYKYTTPDGKIDKSYEQNIMCIDKAIILLYHFSNYLYHISNGSPKKLGLYFEKYVRSNLSSKKFSKIDDMLDKEEIEISNSSVHKTKYYLSFGYLDQRKIGFVHYLSFPVTQAIIDNANQFGDKLLVSGSFLIDHIYKHHNCGFSWRNLEHTPELLEVYRIPELRVFINSIISYLTQTHLLPISCGLYQFKFRKKISEEISMSSKFSEEISALFNFTLDESLSVKRHYTELLTYYTRKASTNDKKSYHVIAGIHHILADLYLSDEEYNKAIFEYQTAIEAMEEEIHINKEINDPHYASHILFLIRIMLKLGLTYEKRKTFETAYVTYNELVCKLINYRYLNEENLGLKYIIKKTNQWPGHQAVLYQNQYEWQEITENEDYIKKIRPAIKNQIEDDAFSVNGEDIITEFAHQMTTDKSSIIMRLSLLEDIRLVYQALLAKLFVLEKIELGGITRANINVVESEYIYLHLATNEKDKFIISADFFRKLGDIMYYKNGLIGKDVDLFFPGLFYWGIDINKEILDYCNEKNCYNVKNDLTKFVSSLPYNGIDKFDNFTELIEKLKKQSNKLSYSAEEWTIFEDFLSSLYISLKEIQYSKVYSCNVHREKLWKKNRRLPCYACKYYNRSLTVLLKNFFCKPMEENLSQEDHIDSKSIIVLYHLFTQSTKVSSRLNYLMQLGDTLDSMGNVQLSCADLEDDNITETFLSAFFNDFELLNTSKVKPIDKEESQLKTSELSALLKNYREKNQNGTNLNKIEKTILYYWEASEYYKGANELKKAADCLKKILQVFLNFIIIHSKHIEKINIINSYIHDIRTKIVKIALLHLYSHYEYINITEIQKIKWVLYVQMYENISLNRLSIFPDIEEIMLVYYEILLKISHYDDKHKLRLSYIYHNFIFSSIRLESTIYERVLSIRFRALLNREILNQIIITSLPSLKNSFDYMNHHFPKQFCKFILRYLDENLTLTDLLGNYSNSIERILEIDDSKEKNVAIKRKCQLLEFLVDDSIYCLTKILETITPFTSTTLFSNSFIAEIHELLFEWNQVFDSLYTFYRLIDYPNDMLSTKICSGEKSCKYKEKEQFTQENKDTSNKLEKCPRNIMCKYKLCFNPHELIRKQILQTEKEIMDDIHKRLKDHERLFLSEVFFNRVLSNIGKSNIRFTLTNYSAEVAVKRYRQAKDMHCEGKSYKDMIMKMHFLDDDLNNDTIQFNSAIERHLINCDYIDNKIEDLLKIFETSSLYDVENFISDNVTSLPLTDYRFNE